ncbi:MAG: 2-keto-4-pentenoate hydratase, partial [Acidimicrobiales bacterium]
VYGWVPKASVVPDGPGSDGPGSDGPGSQGTGSQGTGSQGTVSLGELIHPRCEPELVFLLSDDLAGPGVTAGDVMDATRSIVGGIEIIDSRYEAFSFTLPDVIADNTSAARVLIGSDGVAPGEADLSTLGCLFEVNGEVTGTATGAALLGDPAGCVAMLANHLGKHGQKLEAGWLVMAGAPTDAQPLAVGTTATARYSHLGSVTVIGED